MKNTLSVCQRCKGSGTIETGNNDLPCDCGAEILAKFNVAGFDRPLTGPEARLAYDSDHALRTIILGDLDGPRMDEREAALNILLLKAQGQGLGHRK